MKRILVPFTQAENGGSQLSFLRLAKALKDEYEFHLWFFNKGPFIDKIKEEGFSYDCYEFSSLRNPMGLMKIKSEIKKLNVDYIYLHSSRLISLLAKQLKIPCIEKINMTRTKAAGGWARYSFIDKYFSNLNSQLLVVSQAIRDQMLQRGISKKKISYLHSFINPDKFVDKEQRENARKQYDIPQTAIVVLNIGRMVSQKAQLDFVEAANLLVKNYSDYVFVIVGQGSLEQQIRDKIKQHKLEDRFRLIPFSDEIENIYAMSDIFVHCAHWEPLANVLLEARASNLPIVATDVDGSLEALENYPHADLIAKGDIKAMAEKIDAWSKKSNDIGLSPFPEKFSSVGTCNEFRAAFP